MLWPTTTIYVQPAATELIIGGWLAVDDVLGVFIGWPVCSRTDDNNNNNNNSSNNNGGGGSGGHWWCCCCCRYADGAAALLWKTCNEDHDDDDDNNNNINMTAAKGSKRRVTTSTFSNVHLAKPTSDPLLWRGGAAAVAVEEDFQVAT